jgi:hypothetical protein
MKREINKYFFDIKTSIDSINEYLSETRDFFEYQKNKLLRRGVEREIEIIGEAMSRILKLDPFEQFISKIQQCLPTLRRPMTMPCSCCLPQAMQTTWPKKSPAFWKTRNWKPPCSKPAASGSDSIIPGKPPQRSIKPYTPV